MRTNRTFSKVFLLGASQYKSDISGGAHGVCPFCPIYLCDVRNKSIFQNVQNHPILDLILSVGSCIIQGIRKVEKLSTLERQDNEKP